MLYIWSRISFIFSFLLFVILGFLRAGPFSFFLQPKFRPSSAQGQPYSSRQQPKPWQAQQWRPNCQASAGPGLLPPPACVPGLLTFPSAQRGSPRCFFFLSSTKALTPAVPVTSPHAQLPLPLPCQTAHSLHASSCSTLAPILLHATLHTPASKVFQLPLAL